MSYTTQKKVIIVHDDPGDVLWIRKILEPDYLVVESYDGLQAKEIVDREKPDLVITGVMLPKINGYALCEHLKNNPNTKDIPVVMIIGLYEEINKEISKEIVADAYLKKPVWPNQLYDILSRLLKLKQ